MKTIWVCGESEYLQFLGTEKLCQQKTIRFNENLNLPGQHELLARAMCNKISTSLLENYKNLIASQVTTLNEGQLINDLGSLMGNWKSELLGNFRR